MRSSLRISYIIFKATYINIYTILGVIASLNGAWSIWALFPIICYHPKSFFNNVQKQVCYHKNMYSEINRFLGKYNKDTQKEIISLAMFMVSISTILLYMMLKNIDYNIVVVIFLMKLQESVRTLVIIVTCSVWFSLLCVLLILLDYYADNYVEKQESSMSCLIRDLRSYWMLLKKVIKKYKRN